MNDSGIVNMMMNGLLNDSNWLAITENTRIIAMIIIARKFMTASIMSARSPEYEIVRSPSIRMFSFIRFLISFWTSPRERPVAGFTVTRAIRAWFSRKIVTGAVFWTVCAKLDSAIRSPLLFFTKMESRSVIFERSFSGRRTITSMSSPPSS